jgi:CubicO group peptidase (beta-lactamase class C family)
LINHDFVLNKIDRFNIPGLLKEKTIKHDPDNVFKLTASPLNININKIIFSINGKKESVGRYLFKTGTRGIIILHCDSIIHERYSILNNPNTLYPAWSMTKALSNAAIGSLIYEKVIGSELDPIDKYSSTLVGSAYEGVTFQQALRQSSAVKASEILDMPAMALYLNIPGNGWESYLLTRKRMMGYEPGSVFNYTELDPAAIALGAREASGYSLSEYLQEKIWKTIGMESDAYYQTDNNGKETGGTGLKATLRDYARLGLLYANNGTLNGQQVFTPEWVKKSTEVAYYPKGKLSFKKVKNWGYGYFWWPSIDNQNDFFITGLFGQFIYVDPDRKIVIARTGFYIGEPVPYFGGTYLDSVFSVSRAIRDQVGAQTGNCSLY